MVFVGDRYLTDGVFGNRHGMLTIRVAPLTPKGEPPTVAAARVIEEACVARWSAAGMRPAVHPLLPHEAVASVLTSPPPQANHSSQNEK
jgi:phosphatidylglycerophosphatase GEP4